VSRPGWRQEATGGPEFISAMKNGIPFALSSGEMGIFFPSAPAFGQHELN